MKIVAPYVSALYDRLSRWWPRSMVSRLLLLIVFAVFIAQTGAALLIASGEFSGLRRAHDQRLADFTETRAEILGPLVWRLRYEDARAILEEMVREGFVLGAFVYDDTGALVAAKGETDGAAGEETTRISRPLFYDNGLMRRAPAGRLEVVGSLAPIQGAWRDKLIQNAVIALISAAVVSLAISFGVRRLVAWPLSRLLSAIRASGRGESFELSRHARDDEMGVVFRAFDELQTQSRSAFADLRRANDKLRDLAERDDVTGLLNRRAAWRRLQELRGRSVALCFLDLDRFKAINETFGHAVGDRVLKTFAAALERTIAGRGEAFRFGGDEFLAIAPDIDDAREGLAFAQELCRRATGVLVVGEAQVAAQCSAGVVLSPAGETGDSCFALADLALSAAKRAGRNRAALVNEEMRRRHAERAQLEKDLVDALAAGAFDAHFQPQYDLRTGAIVGCEALSRWTCRRRGPVSPATFMPVLEEMGLSLAHGRQMALRVCRAAARLQAEATARGEAAPPVSLNVNARQIADPGFCAGLLLEVSRHGLLPSRIEIEITESQLMQDLDAARDVLQNLRRAGFSVALDDFGTGYSSLSYLTRMPFDRIKLDRSFVRRAVEDEKTAAIVGLVANLARTLELGLVAEGIETLAEEIAVRALGVQVMQGFRYARPMPLDELSALLAGGRAATGSIPNG